MHWLKHDKSDELVPVVGKVGHIYQTVVLQRADMDFVQSYVFAPDLSGAD